MAVLYIKAGTIYLSPDSMLSQYLGADSICIAIAKYWLGFLFAFLTRDHGEKVSHLLVETVYHESYFQKQCTSHISQSLSFISAASLLYYL